MSYKLLFWSDREVSFSAALLLAACAFALTTLVVGASNTMDLDPANISAQNVLAGLKRAFYDGLVHVITLLNALSAPDK